MTTPYNISSTVKGVNGFGLGFCDTIYSVTLVAGTNAAVTTPGQGALGSIGVDTFVAVFSYAPGATVWVALDATAQIPAGQTLMLTNSELNPSAKTVRAGDQINLISEDGGDVSIAFYAN